MSKKARTYQHTILFCYNESCTHEKLDIIKETENSSNDIYKHFLYEKLVQQGLLFYSNASTSFNAANDFTRMQDTYIKLSFLLSFSRSWVFPGKVPSAVIKQTDKIIITHTLIMF